MYADFCGDYQFGFKKGHTNAFCARIVKQSVKYYISIQDRQSSLCLSARLHYLM